MRTLLFALLLSSAVVGTTTGTAAAAEIPGHSLFIDGGTFHGPGKFPDSPLPTGVLGGIELGPRLTGVTRYFNNGSEPPNVPGGAEMVGAAEGRMSDGTPFNEHVWGGVAMVGRGAMSFMTVVASGGPNEGQELYEMGEDLSWHIYTDLALDPGFPEGIVLTENIHITSGVLRVPLSLQTLATAPGGIDRAGSLPSGAPVFGRLGDRDGDGMLDGTIVGASNVPAEHIFTPGAPVVQRRDFHSDIPIPPVDAAALALASAAQYGVAWKDLKGDECGEEAATWVADNVPELMAAARELWHEGATLLATAAADDPSPELKDLLRRVDDEKRRFDRVVEWAREARGDRFPPPEMEATARASFEAAGVLAREAALLGELDLVRNRMRSNEGSD
jgi:hypothetical protein